MPTKRQRVTRSLVARITPEAIEAWRAGRWIDLQRAQGVAHVADGRRYERSA